MNCRPRLLKRNFVTLLASLATLAIPLLGNAQAASIMPDFSAVPSGWVTDRYEPTSFSNVGTFQGRNNVLGIEITSAGDLANRPAPYQSTFYNTQGRQYALTGGAGSVLSADLWIPTSWGNPTNGSVRTDMWGVMSDATAAVTDYPIIGFTNYGGAARYRVWDQDTANGWVDLATPVASNAWTSLAIAFTGTSYVYSIDGSTVYTDTTISGSTSFSGTIMQAYNFADPAITGALPIDYTAYWANPVPEPETYAMMLTGLGLMGFVARRRKHKKASPGLLPGFRR